MDIEYLENLPKKQKIPSKEERPTKILGKPVIFTRYGDLSPVVQKGYKKEVTEDDFWGGFHNPPAPKGVYAFVWPYIDLYLVPSTLKKPHSKARLDKEKSTPDNPVYKYKKPKTFNLKKKQELWHHLDKPKDSSYTVISEKGAWRKTTYEDYCKALKEELHKCSKKAVFKQWGDNTQNWQKGYPLANIDKCHLEVFIERP